MKKFKKMLAVLTAVLMLCCMLPFFTACGGDFYPNYPKSNENPYALQPKNTPKPAPIKAPEHDPNEAVVFSDPGFEYWFRTTYNYGEHEIITYGKLLEITELELSEHGYQSFLKDIAMFANLTVLDLSNNKISDISLLSGLTNLTELNLQGNEIVDISPLAGLTNLKTLILYHNQIFDISPLSRLTNLTELDLSYNDRIFYLDALSGLKNLTVLNLSKTLDPKADLSPLAGLTKLTKLNLEENHLSSETDVSPLFNLTILKELYIIETNLTQEQIDAIQSHLPNCEIK